MADDSLSGALFSRLFICLGLILTIVTGAAADEKVVNVYVALDQVYSEPILKAFESSSGIKVQAKYDVEAVKTVGLANALVAEKGHPRCDVWWNNEVMHTVKLQKMDLLAAYRSPAAQTIPDRFKDPEGFWTGMAARARVLIFNHRKIGRNAVPAGIHDFLQSRWRDDAAIALPLFGTTATHAAALFSIWGDAAGASFFRKLKANGIVVAAGNAQVKDLVASGEVAFGLTDTDDAHVAYLAGSPIGTVFPDQNDLGTLVLPCTVAMIKGCPHPEAAKRLIDALLDPAVEEQLAWGRSAQIPVRASVSRPPEMPALDRIRTMPVNYADLAAANERAAAALKAIFWR